MRKPENYLEDLLEKIEGGVTSVLDVGTGPSGPFHYWFWQKQDLRRKACVDIHSIREDIEGWEKHIADSRDLPFPDNSFDLVSSTEMIEHIPPEDHRRVLRELKRVAGKAVFLTTSGEAAHRGPEQEELEKINPHQAYKEIVDKKLLIDEGFKIMYYHKGMGNHGYWKENIKAYWIAEEG